MTPIKALLCSLTLACATWPAHAIYKIVGPDGKVTYTDRRPTEPSTTGRSATPTDTNSAALPYELRQTMQRFPVTLYTTPACTPCDAGRQLLTQRGIPYTEKTIQTTADNDALEQAVGSKELPVLKIGSQVLKSFATSEWQNYLSTAGYPPTSQLPRGFTTGQASPLTTPKPEPVASTPAPAEPEPQPAAAPSSQPRFRF